MPVSTHELPPGAKEGATFQSMSVVPLALVVHMQQLFFRGGGRMFRGTVRHVEEIAHGGVASFQRLQEGVISKDSAAPSAVVVCLGLGARFLGGIEDKSLEPAQISVIKVHLPAVTSGRAFYDEKHAPILFLVPLGDGYVSISTLSLGVHRFILN